ncbi:response regulator transcription factor [Streptomyces sp. NPDC014746]|uniref:response regulator transcription factor n=1 Tax=Streptomyces sp. NPDC014746 TaxID=3364904 RepID=UPI0036FB2FA3
MGQLSEREHEVLVLLATGGTNLSISRRLGVSEGTVKSHVGRILLKLGLESRTAAAVAAVHYLHPCRCSAPVSQRGPRRVGAVRRFSDPAMPKV